jgi:hypothetical protein
MGNSNSYDYNLEIEKVKKEMILFSYWIDYGVDRKEMKNDSAGYIIVSSSIRNCGAMESNRLPVGFGQQSIGYSG